MKSYEEYYTEFMDSLFKQKISPVWKVIFLILLIVHVIYFYSVGDALGVSAGGVAVVFVLVPLGLLLAIIDFIAVLLYVIKQHPHGIVKFLSYTFLIIVSLIVAYFGIGVINAYFNTLFMN